MKPITGLLPKILIVLCLPSSLTGQWKYEDDVVVPAAVIKEFNAMYPTARQLSWTSEGGILKANFQVDDYFSDAIFLQEGNWVETITIVDERVLPRIIFNQIKEKYSSFSYFDLIIRIDAPKTTRWKLIFYYDEEEITLNYSDNGTLISGALEDK